MLAGIANRQQYLQGIGCDNNTGKAKKGYL